MKHNLLKSVILSVILLMGVSNVWALDANNARIYFDNTNSKWTYVQLVGGHNTWSSGTALSKISNTNDLWTTAWSWGGYTYFMFIDALGSWPGESKEAWNRKGDLNYSATITHNVGSNTYFYYPSSNDKNTGYTTSQQITGYAALNYNQTVQQHLSTNGSAYAASTASIATVKVSSYKLSNATTTAADSKTIASSQSSATCSAARTATVTYSVTGVNTGYKFVGWYDGNTQKSTSTTYTYQATEAKTITARFEKTYAVTISAGANGTVSPTGSQQVGSTNVTIKATANTGYKFKNWTKTGGVVIANANNATTTITATANGTVTANFEEDLSSNWKLIGDNQTNSPFGDNYTYSSGKEMTKKSGHSTESNVYITLDIKHLPASYYGFKVATSNSDDQKYGYGQGEGYYIEFNRSASNTQKQVYSGSQHELKFIPDALGEYEFRVNYPSNKYVYVTFPTAYAVTFGKGTGGSSVTAKYNSTSFNSGTKVQQGKTVTFTQSASTGYTFKEWNTKADGTGTKLSAEATYTHTVTTSNNVYAVYTQNPDRTIYLEPTGFWNSNDPQYVAHVWNNSANEDIIMKGVGEAPYRYYTCEVPGKYTNIVFFRKKSDGSELWNQTGDLTIPTDNKTLYEIKSTGNKTPGQDGYSAATGVWKEANLVYTITLGSSMFGPYGISYNGQSYFSHKDEDVIINVPYGATINFIEGQPYSDIYTGGIMEKGKVRQFDLTQPYTIERDIRFDANYVTKVPQVAYLGVPNSLSGWAETDTRAQYIWRFDSQGDFLMEEVADRGTFEFEVDGVKYYKYTIQAGCNKFQFQHKTKSDSDYNQKTTHHKTNSYLYEVLTTDVNCYMLDGGTYGDLHTGYWCALPARTGDYRLLYVEQVVEKDANGNTVVTRKKAHPSDVVRASELNAQGTIVSLHIYKERTYKADLGGGNTYTSSNNPEVILQRYDGSKWVDEECHMVFGPLETLPSMGMLPGRKNASVGSDKDDFVYDNGIDIIKNDTHPDQGSGVWNFYIIKNGTKVTLDLNRTHRYEGQYYIRTNVAFGEWNSYKGSDNHMTRSDVSKQHSNYSHYYCKWVATDGANLKYTIANDYGMAISDTLTADETDIWGTPIADAQKIVTGETLPTNNEYGGANVRFSWNEKSNFLHRAYLAGSTDVASRFLVLEGKSDEIYNAGGQALALGANGSDRYGLKANEEIFTDISNWVYYADVQLVPNAGLKLTAKYMDKVQYFIGQAGDNYNNTVLAGTGTTGEQKYLIRLLYDFKTNELISAYVPGGNTNIEAIETNLMLIRKENAAPTQLSFNTNNMRDEGKQAYGVLELTKATLIDNPQGKNIYERSLYWISFPFDVRITDIFGFGEYGKHWIIQSYDGAKRAREGLWLESETNWVYHFDPNTLNAGTPDQGIMKRGVGYVVALDLDQINADNPFVGRINTLALYFPSTNTITDHIVNTSKVIIPVPEHVCTINRDTPKGDRRIKDSHWNVIGVPSYINAVGNFGNIGGKFDHIELENRPQQLQFYYRWLGDYDKYEVTTPSATVNFNSLTAYMVQYAGDLTWTSVLNEGPASLAAKRNSDEMEQYHLCLELQQNGQEQDRTFIQLQEDEVTADFDFNYDLCKINNKGANIYSLIATDRDPIEVAGNVLPVEEAIIPLGIKLDAAGEYTFSMPQGTDNIVVELIDYENNTRTNMLLDDYTVTLPAGTNHTRFAIHVQPNKVTTSVGDINSNSNGVKKFLINGQLFMKKDGVLYDAQGKLVR